MTIATNKTIFDTKVDNYFDLDGGKTRRVLSMMVSNGYLDYDFEPRNADFWRENPFTKIANSDKLWAAYLQCWGKTPTLKDFFSSLAICQFFVMDRVRGPEMDGARQMLRKHWYAWGKLALQPAAVRLGVSLMENGTPDSEKLYDLMSRTFGEWNEQGLLLYRQMWIENDTSKYEVIHYHLPAPYDMIVICCEKNAAYQGVLTSAKAMGARAVYSGGGKSSRSGIEKLYDEALRDGVEAGRTVRVLVISDWDTDGESVIAPAFTNQLATYVPADQIESVRVGITPDQIRQFNYDLYQKWYEIKYDVGGGSLANYLTWSRDHAVFQFACVHCGWHGISMNGAICPSCGTLQLPAPEEDAIFLNARNGEKEDWKKEFITFYREYTPRGFELDALTREDYCQLLVDGLSQMVNWNDLKQTISDLDLPDLDDVTNDIVNRLRRNNAGIRALQQHIAELQQEFQRKISVLTRQEEEIVEQIRQQVYELVDQHDEEDEVFKRDPEATPDELVDHMRDSGNQYGWRPFSSYTRGSQLDDIVSREERGALREIQETEYTFTRLNLTVADDDGNVIE